MKTSRQQAEERRQVKLADVQQQIEAGTLTVRKMTDEERAENPPRPPAARRRRR
jgi:tripartite-type tricarboxylate transporter receptor subunit TctC